MNWVVDVVLLALLMFTAIRIARLRGLFSAAIVAGIYSLLGACWMSVLDQPDVAFTEASVGAGISTVLILVTLSLTTSEEKEPEHTPLLPLIVVLVTGAILIYGTMDLPRLGDPQAPTNLHVAPRYIEESPHEIGVPNLVTAILASYRGYDTLGETAVILTAGVGVMILLGGARRRRVGAQTTTTETGE
jgi:multicomponent Na+:H+ antiporter subunit B